MKKNEDPIRECKWKYNWKIQMEIIVYLEIGKKVYENNGNWQMEDKKCGLQDCETSSQSKKVGVVRRQV